MSLLFVEFAFVEADFCSIARLVSGLIVELEFGELTFCLIWVGEFYTVETSVGDRSWNPYFILMFVRALLETIRPISHIEI